MKNAALTVSREMQKQNEVIFELKVSGLQGGYSGEDINKFRTNANKLITRLLGEIQRNTPFTYPLSKAGRHATPKQCLSVQMTRQNHAGKFSLPCE